MEGILWTLRDILQVFRRPGVFYNDFFIAQKTVEKRARKGTYVSYAMFATTRIGSGR
jgi:hypothetical protein